MVSYSTNYFLFLIAPRWNTEVREKRHPHQCSFMIATAPGCVLFFSLFVLAFMVLYRLPEENTWNKWWAGWEVGWVLLDAAGFSAAVWHSKKRRAQPMIFCAVLLTGWSAVFSWAVKLVNHTGKPLRFASTLSAEHLGHQELLGYVVVFQDLQEAVLVFKKLHSRVAAHTVSTMFDTLCGCFGSWPVPFLCHPFC